MVNDKTHDDFLVIMFTSSPGHVTRLGQAKDLATVTTMSLTILEQYLLLIYLPVSRNDFIK